MNLSTLIPHLENMDVLARWLSWFECFPDTTRLQVQPLIMAHTKINERIHKYMEQINIFLSLPLFLKIKQ